MGFTATKKGMSRCSSLQWPALTCPIRLQCSKTVPEAAVQRGRFQRAMDDVVPKKRNRRRQRSKSTTGMMEEQLMGRSSKVSGVWPKAAGAQRPWRSVHAAAQLIPCHRAVGFSILSALSLRCELAHQSGTPPGPYLALCVQPGSLGGRVASPVWSKEFRETREQVSNWEKNQISLTENEVTVP